MTKCILCPKELENESPEHIILNAFGGRKDTNCVLCTECNIRLGNDVDKPFAENFALFLNLAYIKSGKNENPQTLRSIKLESGE
ncbi:HNH endonuclease, partial [Desulfobacterales bacterium HSG2]|nr:HNH endonuclease [Desulfobacterales bacterium HSG2]